MAADERGGAPKPTLAQITAQYQRLKALKQYVERDQAMREMLLARRGKIQHVFPDLFPEDGPFDRSLAANMVDVAARDTAEVLAPLPSFTCSSTLSTTDKAKRFAEKRSKIANNYLTHARVQTQMYTAADRYVSYGFAVAMVEPDYENKMPYIRFLDSMGAYIVRDRFDRIIAFHQTLYYDVDTLVAEYPQYRQHIHDRAISGKAQIEAVRYHDKWRDMLILVGGNLESLILSEVENRVGRCMVREVSRPGVPGPRGQFDDVLALQVAKSRFALLALEGATKAVQAPIAMPQDIQDLPLGADATIRSMNPEKIRRVELNVPREAFQEQALLDQELRAGSRYPEARQGEVEGSIVTGRGVQALMSGFDTQIRTGQAMFAEAFRDLIEMCFEMDEALWPTAEKTIRGNENGTPYEVKYRPAKDIAGDHSVDVQYGLMAGLDPNRALVFGLQARGDKLISREFLRSQMPFSLDPVQEAQKVDVEELREALIQAVAGYAQAIPILAQNGQDPGEVLSRLAAIIVGRLEGRDIEAVVEEAFTPETPPPGVEPPVAGAPPEGAPGEAPPGGAGMVGLGPTGLVRGVAEGQAGMPAGGRPDMQTLLAGLTGRGDAALSANVQRRLPI